jgi:hypothetical protein
MNISRQSDSGITKSPFVPLSSLRLATCIFRLGVHFLENLPHTPQSAK